MAGPIDERDDVLWRGPLRIDEREEIRKRLIAQGVDPVEADRIAVFEEGKS
jgi:hypothetical protein